VLLVQTGKDDIDGTYGKALKWDSDVIRITPFVNKINIFFFFSFFLMQAHLLLLVVPLIVLSFKINENLPNRVCIIQ
jgi:hypothetical protein